MFIAAVCAFDQGELHMLLDGPTLKEGPLRIRKSERATENALAQQFFG